MGILGMVRMWACKECQDRQTDIYCHTFLELHARSDLNNDGTFWNGGNVSNVEKVSNIMTDRHHVS
jgi:hypothetical protein